MEGLRTTGMSGQDAAAAAAPPPVGERGWAVATVLTLSAATGVVEAVCFAHLGHLFAAFVTGTVVLAGLHLGSGGFSALIPYGVAFGGFLVGAVLGGILVGASGAAATLRGLTGEFVLLVLAAIADAVIPHADGAGLVTLALLGVGMAIQFSATKNLKVADLGFAAATGLIHGLVHDFAQRSRVRLPRKFLALFTLLAGACLGGFVSARSIPGALVIASALVAAAAVVLATGSRPEQKAKRAS
jgi:uncharacterized membrane protein YoaK (UPF0700 family)